MKKQTHKVTDSLISFVRLDQNKDVQKDREPVSRLGGETMTINCIEDFPRVEVFNLPKAVTS